MKFQRSLDTQTIIGRPLCGGRGLKSICSLSLRLIAAVAPCAGAWVEICIVLYSSLLWIGRPLCGGVG